MRNTGARNPSEMTLTVKAGDSVPSLAYEHGRYWESVWGHPGNDELRNIRDNPNILCEGDELFIPALEPKTSTIVTGKRHTFRVRGVPSVLRVKLIEPPDYQDDPFARLRGLSQAPPPERPWANVAYRVEVDGEVTTGQTDADGMARVTIPPNARDARLVVAPGTPREVEHVLRLGYIHPIDHEAAAMERLWNIGYRYAKDEGEEAAFLTALEQFQRDEGLEPTGELDEATEKRLIERHGT